MPILKKKELSANEELLVAEVLKHPALQQYLEVLAYNTAVDLAYCPIAFGEDPNKYLQKQQYIKGQLDLLDNLANAVTIATQINQQSQEQ